MRNETSELVNKSSQPNRMKTTYLTRNKEIDKLQKETTV